MGTHQERLSLNLNESSTAIQAEGMGEHIKNLAGSLSSAVNVG